MLRGWVVISDFNFFERIRQDARNSWMPKGNPINSRVGGWILEANLDKVVQN